MGEKSCLISQKKIISIGINLLKIQHESHKSGLIHSVKAINVKARWPERLQLQSGSSWCGAAQLTAWLMREGGVSHTHR